MKGKKSNSLKTQLEICRSALREREKELDCVYNISRIVDTFADSDRIIQEIVNIIPRSWQYPELTCCRADINNKVFITDKFMETEHRLDKDIVVSGEKVGSIEIFYMKQPSEEQEEPFLTAEDSLLGVIAERLGKIFERKRAEKELKASYSKLQELYEHMHSIRYEERKKIAIEVHDEIGQALTFLKIELRCLAQRIEENEITEKLKNVELMVDDVVKKIQHIATELRPVLLDDFGLSEAIAWYIEEIKNRSGIDIDFQLEDLGGLKDKNLTVFIYQIVKELTTNTLRHAAAGRIELNISRHGKKVNIRFFDNGIGINMQKTDDIKSFGIYNLKERVKYWGGKISISNVSGKGTLFNISLPSSIRGRYD